MDNELYKKMSMVMKEINYLKKDGKIEFGTTKYKAITEEKVTETVRKSLIKNGLVIFPIRQSHKREGTLSTVDVVYKIVDIETGQSEELCSSGTGVDTQDKGVGKAMTYAYKYMMLRTFAIPTGEDPDKISSAELDDKEKKMTLCEECNSVIIAYAGKTVEQMIVGSQKMFNAKLCHVCIKKMSNVGAS